MLRQNNLIDGHAADPVMSLLAIEIGIATSRVSCAGHIVIPSLSQVRPGCGRSERNETSRSHVPLLVVISSDPSEP